MNKTNEKKINVFRKVLRNLYPTYIYENVESIPFEIFKENHIKLILLDMDNTLIDNNHIYTNELKNWAVDIKKRGIRLYILSNSPFGDKVKKIANELNMEYKYSASKPFLRGFREVVEETKETKENILMIGDQLFTDIWGGNRFGIKTILVNPIAKDEALVSKIKRPLEKSILKHYLRKKGAK